MIDRDMIVEELEIVKRRVASLDGFSEEAEVIADAIALLKAQEPRVMTLEEACKDIEIWYESVNGACGWGDLCYDTNLELALYTTHGIKGVKEGTYGKTWRCWTSRPTEEQREAVKWEP